MDYLPLFVDLKNKSCLVVGGGDIAARKAGLLIRAGAIVTIVAPEVSESSKSLIDDGLVNWLGAYFSDDIVMSFSLVIAATDSDEVNRQVYHYAKTHHVLVNVADEPELCDFILPSILDRSPIVVAVSSGGKSPILARQLRARLETLIPKSYGNLASLVGGYRGVVKAKFSTLAMRRRFWESILQGPVAEHVLAGRDSLAESVLNTAIENTDPNSLDTGEVYLVGAGPGDPELLTFKALRLMQQADIVFYDRLVSKEVLDLVRKEADQVYVGKQRA